MRARLLVVLLAAGLAAVSLVPAALGDGDPASDILPSQNVFLPYATILSGRQSPAERQLVATVAAANAAGYRIKVAVISSGQDLGSVTALIGKPQAYAEFLGRELAFLYRGPLLIVMADGFGVARAGKPLAAQRARLRGIEIGPGKDGLAEAGTAAVAALASAAGRPVKVPAKTGSGSGSSVDRAVLAGAGVALLAVLVAGTIVWRGRRSTKRREAAAE